MRVCWALLPNLRGKGVLNKVGEAGERVGSFSSAVLYNAKSNHRICHSFKADNISPNHIIAW